MARRIFYCVNCGRASVVYLEVPDRCLGCGETHWRAEDEEPEGRFDLTFNDRRFLRSIRVAVDGE